MSLDFVRKNESCERMSQAGHPVQSINHHTVNSLKRPRKSADVIEENGPREGSLLSPASKTERLIATPSRMTLTSCGRLVAASTKSRAKIDHHTQLEPRLGNPYGSPRHGNKITRFLVLVALCFLCIHLPVTSCDTLCPRDTSPIYPCTCNNGTQGLLIKCSRSNLAIISNAMRYLQDPVEQLEIEKSSISKLFGPLFSDSNQYQSIHANIRELDIRASGLRIIDGSSFSPQLLSNIQFLMLDRNQLQQMPNDLLNNMTNLKMLNLSSNAISSLEANTFSKLTNLTELDLSWNRISRLVKSSFNNMYSLEYLNLNGNDISKLEKNLFAFGRKLRFLDLSNNKLTTLDRQDFNDLTNLESLRVSNNQLTTIPRSIFSRNAKLYNLDLSFNRLDDIDTYLFKSVRFLRDLNISGNLIKEITKNTFSPTTRIKRIDLSQNLISSLVPETFKNLEWLEKIDLSRNQIVNISNDAFNHIFNVEIDLSYNKLTRIFYYAFHDVSNITKLDLSHNLIDDGISLIAFESTDCAHLDLSYNQLQDISKVPISNLTGIRVLDISHNQITEFNKKSFTQKVPLYELHSIDASFNNISQITGNVLERLKSIRTFNISHNSLRRLTSGGLGNSPTLMELDLSYNNLVEVVSGTLVGLISLRNLDMRYNRLKKMIPVPVALNTIRLEHNEIGQLSKSAFPSLNSLLELYLDYNRISHIEEGTFQTLLALHTLSLSYNNISSAPALALKDLTSLQLLKLDGNNIQRLGRKAFGTLPIVFDLFLDHNNITHIADHAFEGMLQLLSLNLSHNNIHELPPEAFSSLVSLRRLDLSSNHVNRFENKTRSAMQDLLSLEWADFSNNKLSMITSQTFLSSPYIPQKLVHLDLSNNLIGIIVNNFANGLRKTEWLSLRNNIINEIFPNVLGNATQLRYLDLSGNKLRGLKEGTFSGSFANLTTISLAHNKLSSLPVKEFEHLKSLSQLDLSSNRLENFHPEFARWARRGMLLDLRHNNLACQCDLLPFVSWIDSIRARNQTYHMTIGHHLAGQNQPIYFNSQRVSSKLLSQYLNVSHLVAGVHCARPEIMSGKSIMHMIELANSNELNCDRQSLEEANAYKRLRAPIQFNGAEYHNHLGRQSLKIGWTLIDPQIDILNFVILKARFQQPIDIAAHRMSTTTSAILKQAQQQLQSQQQSSITTLFGAGADAGNPIQLIEQDVERVPYNQFTTLLHGLDSSAGYYVICITFEDAGDQSPSNMIDLFKPLASGQQSVVNVSASNSFSLILSDYNRINCVDLNTLLRQDISDRLLAGGANSSLEVRISGLFLICLVAQLIFQPRALEISPKRNL